MRVEGDIVIAKPIEEVFDFVADARNEPKYNAQMTSAEMITPEPIGVGTKFQSVMTGTGMAVEITVEFTGFDRPHRIAEKSHMSDMDITGGLFFEPVADGTRMKWEWDLEPRGVYRFLGPLVRRMGDRQERRIWSGLKRVLESGDVPVAAVQGL
jgi:carbon monoxide dehydrogenase subunit G